jgi:hypothetical protein
MDEDDETEIERLKLALQNQLISCVKIISAIMFGQSRKKLLGTLWLPFEDQTRSGVTVLLPLSPQKNSSTLANIVVVHNLESPITWRDVDVESAGYEEVHAILQNALSAVVEKISKRYVLRPIGALRGDEKELSLLMDKVLSCQSEQFVLFDEQRSYWMHKRYESKARGIDIYLLIYSYFCIRFYIRFFVVSI